MLDKKPYIEVSCRVVEIRSDISFLQSSMSGDFGGGSLTDPDAEPAL